MRMIRIFRRLLKLTVPLTICAVAAGIAPQAQTRSELALKAAMDKEVVDGDLKGAIEAYKKVVANAGADRALAAQALVGMAECYQKLGDDESQKIYERLVREYGDQKHAADEARAHLAALRSAASTSNRAARLLWTNPFAGSRGPDTVSPDGRFAGFTDGETGNLAIHDFATGTNRRLTDAGGWAVAYTDAASISPDGQQIAYDMYLDREHALELRVASIAKGESTPPTVALRTGQNEGAYEIQWMPDGKQLVIVRASLDRTSQIGLVSIQNK